MRGAKFTLEHCTDFYVLCATRRFSPRLFADFGYNACLIIYDHDEFIKRFRCAVEKQLRGWSLVAITSRTSICKIQVRRFP